MIGETIYQDADDFGLPVEQRGFRALFAEVVLLAVRDALGESRACGENKNTLKRLALNWINSPATGPASFFWYCSHLDLESSAIRAFVNARAGISAGSDDVAGAVLRAAA